MDIPERLINLGIKKAMVVYLNNGSLESQVSKEIVFNKLIEKFKGEDKGLIYHTQHLAKFEDGSKIFLVPFGQSMIGVRLTHIYLDKFILSLPNAKETVFKTCIHMLIKMDNSKDYDVSGERLFTFSTKGEINPYKGE